MKPTARIQLYQRFWVIGLTIALILVGQLPTADAQTSRPEITTKGADDTFEQTLSQPAQFLQRLGITPEELKNQFKERPYIFVVGAGFVRNQELEPFTDTQNAQQTKSSIQIEGSGSTRILELAAFTEMPSRPSELGIHVRGAGSVRNMNLVSPPSP